MEYPPRFKQRPSENGVALFMVVAAMSLLAILVTEFTYVAQVNSRMAFNSLDQVKAHALAKSGLKLSLLRLKAYQTLKGLGGSNPDAAGLVPKGLLEKVWNFPFFFPIPTEVPGLTPSEKDQIKAFTQSSGFEGRFSAVIESESSKYNLNSLLAPFAAAPSPSPSASQSPSAAPSPGASPSPAPSFNPEAAQKSFAEYVTQLISNKMESDDAFASEYRDYKVDELIDNLIQWVDPTYQRHSAASSTYKPKGGPFYSLTELRMVELLDDELFDVLAPNFTVSSTPGINVNTIKDLTLKALVPGMTKEEVDEFFKFRDSTEADNSFKSADEFFKYIQGNVAAFRNSESEIQKYKDSLAARSIRIITDESHFKVTVKATVNQASRLIEAWVTLKAPKTSTPAASGTPQTDGEPEAPDAGLRITSMRFL
jgi:type II secretory pathway component PulK